MLAGSGKLRELVPQVPAPVIAAALGFRHATIQCQRAAGGGTWSRYATRWRAAWSRQNAGGCRRQ
jgi:hypothetical protein